MPEYLAPGVFVEEVSYRAKSIEGVSTTTTGFVGATRFGPIDIEPDVITSLVEFERIYGGRQQLEFVGTHARQLHVERGPRLFRGRRQAALCRARFPGRPRRRLRDGRRQAGPAGQYRPSRPFPRQGWRGAGAAAILGQPEPARAGEAHRRRRQAQGDPALVVRPTYTVYVGNDAKKGIYFVSYDIQKDLWNFENQDGSSKFELQDLAETSATIRTITASVYVEPSEPGLLLRRRQPCT